MRNDSKDIHLALCTHIQHLWENRILNPSKAKLYPGCGWATELAKLWKLGCVVTGDVAARKITTREWLARNVLIIQADGSKQGKVLEAMQCHALMHICWESPIYAFKVYDDVAGGKSHYAIHHMARPLEEGVKWTHQMYSPMRFACIAGSQKAWIDGYQKGDTHPRLNRVALVAAYKPLRSEFGRCLNEGQWYSAPYGALTDLRRSRSSTYRKAKHMQTHPQRLKLIQSLAKMIPVDIFGQYWENWRPQADDNINILGPCANKQETLRRYEYSLVLENCLWPGYHTEKLAEALAAETIPITTIDNLTTTKIPKSIYVQADILGGEKNQGKHLLPGQDERAAMRVEGRKFMSSSFAEHYFEIDYAKYIKDEALRYIERFRM